MENNDIKEKGTTELFNIRYDLNIIRNALLSISDDIQLNMYYCDVLYIVLEENVLATFPSFPIIILWKFHLGIAPIPKFFLAHL